MLFASYQKVPQGKALIVSSPKRVRVSFTGAVVWAIYNKAEVMDISLKTVVIDRRGSEGLICRDNIRADIKVAFFVRVNKTEDDVIKVAQAIGCDRASDPRVLDELFTAKFSEALKTVGKQLDFVDLYTKREEFRNQIINVIGRDLNGYFLEDAAIDYLEQTPITALDPKNILDAQGIRKITELTSQEHVKTNDFENTEKKLITKQNVEAREAILELERQQADAEARQQREIATVRARETSETQQIAQQELLKSETARITTEEQVAVANENKERAIAVVRKARERAMLVESERVEKDRALEAISREREVEIQRITKDKELEDHKKQIAEVVRQRIGVERNVAVEEEKIKEVRVIEEANRTKQAAIITAEAEAQEKLVKDIKAAEAAEEVAKFRARERLTLADAELEAADRAAKAKIRYADGLQAEAAAPGLAQVRVKEADAAALEKVGMAQARVKELDASASEKMGLAQATVMREQAVSEAEGERQRGLAQAEAVAAKAKAMTALDEAGRGHEEFRLRLEKEREVEIQTIDARRKLAESQAMVLAEALKHSKIDIVGGEAVFLDRIVNAVSMGKAVDGFVGRSDATRIALQEYLSGQRSLPQDLKDVLTRPGAAAGDVQALTLGAILGRLLANGDSDVKQRVDALSKEVQRLGLDDIQV